MVRIYQAGTTTELAGQETVTTGTFSSTVSAASIDVMIISLDKQIKRLKAVDMSSDVAIDASQVVDRQYENS